MAQPKQSNKLNVWVGIAKLKLKKNAFNLL